MGLKEAHKRDLQTVAGAIRRDGVALVGLPDRDGPKDNVHL